MPQTVSIFVLGSVVVACTARVERTPQAGETVRALEFKMELGGKGVNCAVAANRLGATIDGLFAVGDDALGQFACDAFQQSGLSTDLLVRLPGSTGGGVGMIELDGENRIAVHPGANDRLAAHEVRAAASRIAQADLVIAQFEVGDEAIEAAFAVAREEGVRTLLNPSPFRPITPAILRATDILVVNASEAAALAHSLNSDWPPHQDRAGAQARLAQCLLDLGVSMLVITAGVAGATVYRSSGSLHHAAFQVDAVDTVGAGDAFVGGLATILAGNGSAAAALRWASGAGAMATVRFGLLDVLPDHVQLTEFLATAKPRA